MSKSKINIPLRAAGILFCLTLISTCFTSGFYARYISRNTGDDYTSVAQFNDLTILESGSFEDDGTMLIIPGVDLTKNAIVKFDGSASSTFVFAEIEVSPNWQKANNSFAIKQNDKTLMNWSVSNEWIYLKTKNNTHIYYQELEPNTSLESNIVSNNGLLQINNQTTTSDLATINNIYINFRASVIQSNGFETPELAWEAISK